MGLADTALYYYMNDLRGEGATNADTGVDVSANNVPTTQNDFAAHQHMTTFTLGLGLDGELSFRSDYQIANSGDFWRIKQGTLNWPDPKNDSPSALDDLWHAAVNGRGVFFSASNPHELSNSLSDTLDAAQEAGRRGRGGGDLQPAAGGGRQPRLHRAVPDRGLGRRRQGEDHRPQQRGDVLRGHLWSAQSLLNARVHTDRKIFTFDASDPYVATSTGAVGNQLKHFCMSAAPISPWCDDGSGLTVAEQAFFKPTQLPQSP